jgi:hypothetical protein
MLMTLNFSFLSLLRNSVKMFLFSKGQLLKSFRGCLHIFLGSILQKTEFLLIGFAKQLFEIENPCLSMTPTVTLSPISSVRNVGVLFDYNLYVSDHISSIIKSGLSHVRGLRRLRPILDQTTAHNIATALIYF